MNTKSVLIWIGLAIILSLAVFPFLLKTNDQQFPAYFAASTQSLFTALTFIGLIAYTIETRGMRIEMSKQLDFMRKSANDSNMQKISEAAPVFTYRTHFLDPETFLLSLNFDVTKNLIENVKFATENQELKIFGNYSSARGTMGLQVSIHLKSKGDCETIYFVRYQDKFGNSRKAIFRVDLKKQQAHTYLTGTIEDSI